MRGFLTVLALLMFAILIGVAVAHAEQVAALHQANTIQPLEVFRMPSPVPLLMQEPERVGDDHNSMRTTFVTVADPAYFGPDLDKQNPRLATSATGA